MPIEDKMNQTTSQEVTTAALGEASKKTVLPKHSKAFVEQEYPGDFTQRMPVANP